VLDWMLPGLSGIELCRRLRTRPETRQVPIIMLTARGEESERVRGLATGADDYIVKPFSVPELLARVKGLLRRARPERLATVLAYGDIELDRDKRRVARSGRPIDLGPTEYRLLEFFLEHPGRVFSREQLLDGVWGRDIYIDERTVDVHIGPAAQASQYRAGAGPDPHRPRRRLPRSMTASPRRSEHSKRGSDAAVLGNPSLRLDGFCSAAHRVFAALHRGHGFVPAAARLSASQIAARVLAFSHYQGMDRRPGWIRKGEHEMAWKTPKIVEVPVGMEINMYACAARK